MSARHRTARDHRRRSSGQNFLTEPSVIRRLLARAELQPDQTIVEFGAGRGALTLALAKAGANVIAVEHDPVWAKRLRDRLQQARLASRVRVVQADLRAVRLPDPPYRVVANPPFSLTTVVLDRLLDDPDRGPWRADLLLQWQVARKRAAEPPISLRSAAWAPWWSFELGEKVSRRAFRPVPRVDAGWLTIRKREPPLLPVWLASDFSEALREIWDPPAHGSR